jgi:alkaline phosphatase
MADPEDEGERGYRTDGRNLIAEWRARFPAGEFVWNNEQFSSLDARKVKRVLGLFERSHMEYDADREGDTGGEPSLGEMTGFAIRLLQRNDKGFFLMVEAGRIDHGHHASNAYRALTDTIALSQAVAVAVELTSAEDTLIIVTADHSHTLTIAGYPARGNPILGKVTLPTGELATDATGLAYTTLQYANGPGALSASGDQPVGSKTFPHRGHGFTREPFARPDLTEVDTSAQNFLQEALVPMTSEDLPHHASGDRLVAAGMVRHGHHRYSSSALRD